MTDMLGRTLGPYTVTERLGRGGMAEVYKAFHTGLAVHRAIKVIHPDLAAAADFRTRFQQEAQAVASLRHRNIVQVNDFGSQDGTFYMVMEFVDGQDLKKVIQTEGAMRSIPRAVEIVIQLADALAYAHERHIVHRDVKPENVMLSRDGTPVLMDFGIARLLIEGTRLTQTGTSMGTPAYMAPEQATGAASVGPPADVYALSIVLYELLTGQVPFSADTPVAMMIKAMNDPLPSLRRLRSEVSEALEGVIVTGSAKRPEDRYPTAAHLRDDLRALAAEGGLVEGQTAAATVVSGARVASMPRNRLALTASAALFLAASAGAAWWYLSEDELPAAAVVRGEPPASETLPVTAAVAVTEETAPASTVPPAAETVAVADGTETAAALPTPLPEPFVQPAPSIESPRSQTAAPAQLAIAAPPLEAADSVPPPSIREVPAAPDDTRVQRGVTTQRDLLRVFGGPDISTRDRARREVWVYQRARTTTDARMTRRDRDKMARLGLFFGNLAVGAGGGLASSTGSSSVSRQIRTLTVTVTFAEDRTVADYTVDSTYF